MANNPDWQVKTQAILDANNHRHAKLPKDVSYRTREARAAAVFLFMNLLRSLGFTPDPHNLSGTHIEKLIWY
ncbi:MAG TPA: hypothetical protein VN277_00680 [Acidiferrobacterales bacterium]|nr:hypothetical protein [Acidiferrobacterales bacterium]